MELNWFTLSPVVAMLVAGLGVAAERLRVPPASLMLSAGIALSLSGLFPTLALNAEFVLLVLLPPLLYSAGVGMSWRGFRHELRPILLLAVGCVLFSAAGVAAAAHYVLGLPWAVGFVLGAIVSPPDAVAPMSILRRLGLPRRISTILKGESLVNDATALVALSFAVGAVATGDFSIVDAAARFSVIVAGEIVWGVAVGWGMLLLRQLAHEPRGEILLALVTPFAAFWPPHEFGASGVIACVTVGLWVSWNGHKLISPATRLQGFFIWGLVGWSIEGLIFLLTGLQASGVVEALGPGGLGRALAAGLLASLTVIAVRFLWVFPAVFLSRLFPPVRRHDGPLDRRAPVVIAFTGLRGSVSLVAALSVPISIGGDPFPERALILFATFTVIVVTLLGLGGLLPPLVRTLGLDRAGADESAADRRDERKIRLEGNDAVLKALDDADAPARSVEALRRKHGGYREHLAASADGATADDPVLETGRLELAMLRIERGAAGEAYEANRLTDEARRRIERELDLEDARVRDQIANGGANAISRSD